MPDLNSVLEPSIRHQLGSAPRHLPALRDVWRTPLEYECARGLNAFLCRLMTSITRRYVIEIRGRIENLAPERDPFVLALNHSQRLEALLIPTTLIHFRRGKMIHFMADWNFMMIPFVSMLYRRSGVIVVTKKSAKPKFLNVVKRKFFNYDSTPMERAQQRLEAGYPVGIFPEGTVNRNPRQLLRGRNGAARLSVMAGVPVVPIGIRFPQINGDRLIPDGARMSLNIGEPLDPPASLDPGNPNRAEADAFHAMIMRDLSRLSGKSWEAL